VGDRIIYYCQSEKGHFYTERWQLFLALVAMDSTLGEFTVASDSST
jgi:hypothetical protein